MKTKHIFAAALLSIVSASSAVAEDVKLDVKGEEPVLETLQKLRGKKVGLRLTTGDELTGVVSEVGESAVLLSQLTGREFFDAVVPLDSVTALVVRRGEQAAAPAPAVEKK